MLQFSEIDDRLRDGSAPLWGGGGEGFKKRRLISLLVFKRGALESGLVLFITQLNLNL